MQTCLQVYEHSNGYVVYSGVEAFATVVPLGAAGTEEIRVILAPTV